MTPSAGKFFTKDIALLMSSRFTRPILELFNSSFLIAYLLQIANSDIKPIAVYNIFYALTVCAVFVFMGNFLKQKNKMIIFRAGIILSFFHLLAIMLLKESAITYIIPLGISYGLYIGLYASANNNLTSEKVPARKMGKYVGYITSLSNVAKIGSSYLLGKFISVSSFESSAIIILAICIVEIIISLFLKSESSDSASFSIRRFLAHTSDDNVFRKIFFIEFLKGFTISGCLVVLLTLYIIFQFKTNLNLGIFNSLFGILTVVIAFVFGHYVNRKHYAALSIINTFFIILTAFLFAFYESKINFILYNICYASFVQLIQLISDTNIYNISHSYKIRTTYRTEYFAMREVYLNAGRVVGFLLLFLAGSYRPEYSLKWLLISMTLIVSYIGILSNRLQNYLNEEYDDDFNILEKTPSITSVSS